ncbi:MAG: tryptophan--tRNA ligase [Bdellovibrionia bacterium]
MSDAKKVLLSAIQPSNRLTLGNYLGAIRNWLELQKNYDCLFFAGDLHTITVRQNPSELREQTYRIVATYLAAGIDPNHATLFLQSHVPEHSELAWVLGCFASTGELNRMTQFKDKSAKEKNTSAGLLTYPLLMAADILLYQTHLVPVGEDQKQHIELTRDLALRLNHTYQKPLFTLPEAFSPKIGARIMSLQNPTAKMSKSDPDPNGAIYLTDTDEQILKKMKRAVTDSGQEITDDPAKPGIQNLIQIQSAITGKTPEQVVAHYAGKQYGHLKLETAEHVIELLRPIRTRTDELLGDLTHLDTTLKKGAQEARLRAQKTLSEVYHTIGLVKGRF